MRTVGRYLKPYLGRITIQMIVKFMGTVVELFLPRLLSTILNVYAPSGDKTGVFLLGGAMLLCAALAWIGNIAANRMSTTTSRMVIRGLRADLFRDITRLSAAQRDQLTEASLISRLTSDTYNVHNMVDRLSRIGIRAPILLIGGIFMSLTLDPVLTLVLLSTLPFLMVIVVWSSKKGVPLFTHVQQAQDLMVRKVQENMSGARVIRALSCNHLEQESFEKCNDGVARAHRKADYTMAVVSPAVNLILNSGLAIVVLVGAIRVAAGEALPGTIIAFLSYFTIILNAMMTISRIFILYSRGSASARRIEEVMQMPYDLQRQTLPAGTESADADECIRFDHVTFSYNKNYPNVDDLTFELKKGQRLGIIGPTGSGKSTLLYLLLRMYDPDKGCIYLNGKPLQSLTPEEIYGKLGVVFQNDFLMADTVRENIRFGREADDAMLEEIIDVAQASFIRTKPGGFDFGLNVKGHNLSGGQQQRTLISRSLCCDPELILLDDSSSALDYRTDLALRRAIRERFTDATTIIVAQRISAVMASDLILVMDEGRIIGKGTHQELLASCPMYRELTKLQLGGDAV